MKFAAPSLPELRRTFFFTNIREEHTIGRIAVSALASLSNCITSKSNRQWQSVTFVLIVIDDNYFRSERIPSAKKR